MTMNNIEAFNRKLDKQNLMGQWVIAASEGSDEKTPEPYCWKWDQISAAINEAKDEVDLTEQPQGARRSIMLMNPSGRATAPTFGIGYQSVKPGEVARAHRHSLTAFRFVIEGSESMYTNVEGERFPMKTGDLILTPRMTWHDHVNESKQEAIWLDCVDGPFVRHLGAGYVEDYDGDQQPEEHASGYHRTTFSPLYGNQRDDGDEINPQEFEGDGSHPPSPPFRYTWDEVEDVLRQSEEQNLNQDPVDGTVVEYKNPITGDTPTLETLALSLRLLSGEEDGRHRHNSAEVCYVAAGSGTTRAGDQELTWEEGDCFVIPSGEWHSHATASEKSILFAITDRPIFESFNIHKQDVEAAD